jgi:hypothetical protein
MRRRHIAGIGALAVALACAGSSAPGGASSKADLPVPDLPPKSELVLDPANRTVRFFKGQDLSRELDADPVFKAARAAGDAEGVARAFLDHFAGLWRLDDPKAELALRRVDVDRSGASHVRFDQVWRGLPVADAKLNVHLDRNRRVVLANGVYVPTPRAVETTPSLDAAAARAAAAREIGGEPCAICAVDLVVFAEAGAAPRLAWRVAPEKARIRGEEVMVDAASGAVLRRVPASQSGLTKGR